MLSSIQRPFRRFYLHRSQQKKVDERVIAETSESSQPRSGDSVQHHVTGDGSSSQPISPKIGQEDTTTQQSQDSPSSSSMSARGNGPTINDKFPNLRGMTQDMPDFDLYDYFGDSWGIVFMHPGDFTPVCTTELGTAALMSQEFATRDVKLCGFSCDDWVAHHAWIADIERVTGGLVTFPIFCDPTREVAYKLGILDAANRDSRGLPLTIRSVYILKPDKTVALMMTYPASIGRNFDEILRVVDALQLSEKHNIATPANWKRGDDVVISYALDNEQAEKTFGQVGYRIISVPSEDGKALNKNYLRFTQDPSRMITTDK